LIAVVAATTCGQPDNVRGKDLPTVAERAKSGGLDNGVAPVVVVLRDHFAATEADPQSDGGVQPITIVIVHGLLHGDGAPECGRCRSKDHHEAVTQVLHLGATRFGDSLAQEGEMSPPQLIGVFRRLQV
jgi:hypothetical protein